ncbi:MAG: translation initiation factor IF-3 [Chloroflexi bacterium]|nr:translation initiation factor IF-3 [Chloroflexota bacterium]
MEANQISRDYRINEEIWTPEVRLIDETGRQLGIFSIRDALRLAQERDLDLVEVAPNASPPVCRLLNYGKFLYERAKKEREARKAQKVTEIKEIRMRPKIGEHDINVKLRRVREFLDEGAKVKIRVRFRGREMSYQELGRKLLDDIAARLADVAMVEQEPHMEGPTMLMLVTSKAKATSAGSASKSIGDSQSKQE